MTHSNKKPSLLNRLLSPIKNLGGKSKQLAYEKARLEAFLTAFPGEYCGFASDGSVAYSQGFCDIIGVDTINVLSDIQEYLPPSDAAVLEGYFDRLNEKGTEFILLTTNLDETKNFKITGARGKNLDGSEHFDVLWIEDITQEQQAIQAYDKEKAERDAVMKRFQDSLSSLPFACWMRDKDQKIIWINDNTWV